MSNINQYPLTATQINDEDYYDVDYWNGSTYETRKISGATLKSVISALGSNIYNTDGTLTGLRFVNLNGNILYFTDLAGQIEIRPNEIRIQANAGGSAIFKSIAGNGQKRGWSLQENGDDRWELVGDGIETGANVGTDLKLYHYDDAGVLIGIALSVNRATGQIQLNESYTLPTTDGNDGDILQTDGLGSVTFQNLNAYKNLASTQWSRTLASPQSLPNGATANGFTFFDSSNKVATGTTTHDEYNISYGISITLSGTGGTANINIDGTNYLATFNTDLYTTAQDFVATHQVALNAINVRVFALGSGADGRLRFSSTQTILDAITITNVSGNLSGTIGNEFTGTLTSSPDHVLIPYTGTPIDGQRLHHIFRTNFNFDTTGQEGWAELSLKRYSDDTIIGSAIAINKNADVGGVQTTFNTYTANAIDPFVTGGFYFALRNTIGQTISFVGNVGILIQTAYENPTKF